MLGGSIGAGELAGGVDMSIVSGLSPELLMAMSLPLGLASLLLCCEVSFASLDSSPFRARLGLSPPLHEGISHTTPVKLFNVNGFLSHLRQALPDRSRARRPALMAPWLALGPNLCAALIPLTFDGLAVPV